MSMLAQWIERGPPLVAAVLDERNRQVGANTNQIREMKSEIEAMHKSLSDTLYERDRLLHEVRKWKDETEMVRQKYANVVDENDRLRYNTRRYTSSPTGNNSNRDHSLNKVHDDRYDRRELLRLVDDGKRRLMLADERFFVVAKERDNAVAQLSTIERWKRELLHKMASTLDIAKYEKLNATHVVDLYQKKVDELNKRVQDEIKHANEEARRATDQAKRADLVAKRADDERKRADSMSMRVEVEKARADKEKKRGDEEMIRANSLFAKLREAQTTLSALDRLKDRKKSKEKRVKSIDEIAERTDKSHTASSTSTKSSRAASSGSKHHKDGKLNKVSKTLKEKVKDLPARKKKESRRKSRTESCLSVSPPIRKSRSSKSNGEKRVKVKK